MLMLPDSVADGAGIDRPTGVRASPSKVADISPITVSEPTFWTLTVKVTGSPSFAC
ncbi:MAG: Uncharacterised protein [Methanobacteriota archaeon]|nr:MAG: Uncharacterised protein [Euryarchaeota archaeon]